jgi:hypothetical protein
MAQAEHRDTVGSGPQQPEDGSGRFNSGKHTFVDALLNVRFDVLS